MESNNSAPSAAGPKPNTPLKPASVHKFKPKSKAPEQDGGFANDFLCYALAAHNLLITCQYVLTISSMNEEFAIVAFCIFVVALHAGLSELLLRGLKRASIRAVIPWFVATMLEEIILISLFISHLNKASTDPDIVVKGLFHEKGAYMILTLIATSFRLVLWAKALHSILRKEKYEKL